MAPRRLVMAAAVDEQVEVQLPFHRASPCRCLPPSPRWEGGRRIGNVCPGGQLRQDGYGLREVDVARQSSDAGRNPAGYFPRLPIRRRAALRYRPPRRGHKDLAVEVVDQLRGRNKSLTDSPAEREGFELSVPVATVSLDFPRPWEDLFCHSSKPITFGLCSLLNDAGYSLQGN